uniref:Uncharacterized protein n=1 Tax=Marseillevirus LCMAC201 TaxID=2506605 RepID=A0A481YY80_9VIRU|nr:MAG: hypothetical protein LCMAC201_04140 [Marseillevirus LCMAC201]
MTKNFHVFPYAAPYYAKTPEQQTMKKKYPSEEFVSLVYDTKEEREAMVKKLNASVFTISHNICYAPRKLYEYLQDHKYPSRTLDTRGIHIVYDLQEPELEQLKRVLGFELQGSDIGHYEFMQWGHVLMTGSPMPDDCN